MQLIFCQVLKCTVFLRGEENTKCQNTQRNFSFLLKKILDNKTSRFLKKLYATPKNYVPQSISLFIKNKISFAGKENFSCPNFVSLKSKNYFQRIPTNFPTRGFTKMGELTEFFYKFIYYCS